MVRMPTMPSRAQTNSVVQRQRVEQEKQAPLHRLIVQPITNVKTDPVTLHTVTSDRFFRVGHLSATNTSAADIRISLYRVGGAGAATAQNAIYSDFVLWPNTTEVLKGIVGAVLEPGDRIVAVSSDPAGGANFNLSGEEILGSDK